MLYSLDSLCRRRTWHDCITRCAPSKQVRDTAAGCSSTSCLADTLQCNPELSPAFSVQAQPQHQNAQTTAARRPSLPSSRPHAAARSPHNTRQGQQGDGQGTRQPEVRMWTETRTVQTYVPVVDGQPQPHLSRQTTHLQQQGFQGPMSGALSVTPARWSAQQHVASAEQVLHIACSVYPMPSRKPCMQACREAARAGLSRSCQRQAQGATPQRRDQPQSSRRPAPATTGTLRTTGSRLHSSPAGPSPGAAEAGVVAATPSSARHQQQSRRGAQAGAGAGRAGDAVSASPGARQPRLPQERRWVHLTLGARAAMRDVRGS